MRSLHAEEGFCPVLRPTRAAFERPFCDFVSEVFAKNPDLACFKVVPPKGWTPRRAPLDLEKVRINTPIRQHAFGKGGAYVCILEEQRGMTAADFKRSSTKPEHQPPAKGHRDDSLSERAFWSSVTSSPPLYGADTPTSLFDAQLPWGWNLRRLGCMLQDKEYEVPDIPGVTSPMTYFGQWKSFFAWHKEDIDLYSVNYLHFGAPKVWYCVSPRDNARFEAMAQALFPDHHRACPAFMRHKDILISPNVLRRFSVPFVRAKQEAGEFIVLNASAFHAGFNLGFNCAEAVNFATEDWLEAGKAAVPCSCAALPEGVQLDMGIFCPELRESSSDEEDTEEEEEEGSGSEEECSSSEDEEGQQAARRRRRRTPLTQPRGRAGARKKRSAAARSSSIEGDSSDVESPAKRRRTTGGAAKPTPAARRMRTPKLPDLLTNARAGELPREATHAAWGRVAEPAPLALVERDERTRQLRVSLVHRLAKACSKAGAIHVGLLQEGPDGLHRPQSTTKLLTLGVPYPRIVRVRADWVQPEGKRRGGWALKTKLERIVM